MRKLLPALALAATVIASPALASMDYICHSGRQSHVASLNDAQDAITWRGRTYPVNQAEGCRVSFAGDGIYLCTATQGVADLKVDGKTFNCQMRK